MRLVACLLLALLLAGAAGCLRPGAEMEAVPTGGGVFVIHSPSPADIPMTQATEAERMARELDYGANRLGIMSVDMRAQRNNAFLRLANLRDDAMLLPETQAAMIRYFEARGSVIQDELLSVAEARDILHCNEALQINKASSRRIAAYEIAGDGLVASY